MYICVRERVVQLERKAGPPAVMEIGIQCNEAVICESMCFGGVKWVQGGIFSRRD